MSCMSFLESAPFVPGTRAVWPLHAERFRLFHKTRIQHRYFCTNKMEWWENEDNLTFLGDPWWYRNQWSCRKKRNIHPAGLRRAPKKPPISKYTDGCRLWQMLDPNFVHLNSCLLHQLNAAWNTCMLLHWHLAHHAKGWGHATASHWHAVEPTIRQHVLDRQGHQPHWGRHWMPKGKLRAQGTWEVKVSGGTLPRLSMPPRGSISAKICLQNQNKSAKRKRKWATRSRSVRHQSLGLNNYLRGATERVSFVDYISFLGCLVGQSFGKTSESPCQLPPPCGYTFGISNPQRDHIVGGGHGGEWSLRVLGLLPPPHPTCPSSGPKMPIMGGPTIDPFFFGVIFSWTLGRVVGGGRVREMSTVHQKKMFTLLLLRKKRNSSLASGFRKWYKWVTKILKKVQVFYWIYFPQWKNVNNISELGGFKSLATLDWFSIPIPSWKSSL